MLTYSTGPAFKRAGEHIRNGLHSRWHERLRLGCGDGVPGMELGLALRWPGLVPMGDGVPCLEMAGAETSRGWG